MLTRRQKACLDYVASHLRATGGVSPSYREIAAGLGLKSQANVLVLLRQLQARGALRLKPYRHRSLELVHKAPRTPAMGVQLAAYFRFDDETKELVPWIPPQRKAAESPGSG